MIRLSQVIGAGRDMATIFDAFAAEIERFVPYDRCSLGFFSPDHTAIHVAHVRGPLPNYPSDGDPVPLEATAVGWVIQHRRPLIHSVGEPGTEQFPEDQIRRALGVRQAILLPVMVDNRVVGALAVSSRQPGIYERADVAVLETFVGQLGLAIAATNLRRDAERRARQAEFIASMASLLADSPQPISVLPAVLERASSILGDLNAVFLLDAVTGAPRLEALHAPDPHARVEAAAVLAGLVQGGADGPLAPVFSGQPIVLTEISPAAFPESARTAAERLPLQTVVAAGMVAGGDMRGVFVSAQTRERAAAPEAEPLTDDHARLAGQLATRLGSVLLITRLHEETRQALEQSEALRRIGQELAGSTDLGNVLELVANFARLLIGGDFAGVSLEDIDHHYTWRALAGTRIDAYRDLRYGYGFGPAGRVAATRRTVLIEGFPDNPEFPPDEFPLLRAEQSRSALAAPLQVGDRIFGALVVAFRTPHVFTPAEVRLAESLAAQAAIAADHARLFEEAQEAIRQRDRFLSVAAHELRTPLTTLRGRIQLLQRRIRPVLPPNGDEAIQVVLRQVDRLARMVNDLLDVSRVQAGGLPLRRERVDLVALVRESVSAVVDDEIEGEPEIALTFDTPELVIWADPWRIEQVLANLLSNARRFTGPEGKISVRVSRQGQQARVEISDEGIGLSPEHLEQVFEPFFQVSPEPRVGVGLGLAICRQIVENHEGRLWASSPGIDRGTTFVMTLPLLSKA